MFIDGPLWIIVQGYDHCGTNWTGWLRGPHPATPGVTIEGATFCFDSIDKNGSGKNCNKPTLGKVTHCGEYFVYYLPDVKHCYMRYCATDLI